MTELPDWVKPGVTFRDYTNPNRKDVWHIRAIVDDDVVIARRWRVTKQYWHYECLSVYFFTLGRKLYPK